MTALADEACCRYCLDGGGEALVSPCLCKGTQAFIHISCQKKGYEVNENTICPVCKARFNNVIEEPLEDIQGWRENSVKNLVYFVPAFNTCGCVYSFIRFIGDIDIRWIPYEAQFALFQIAWQMSLLTIFYIYMIVCKVHNKKKYVYLTFFESPYSYINLHIYVWLYIICGISTSKSSFYQLVGLMSQCFIHVHIFRHVDVLEKINIERDIQFIS